MILKMIEETKTKFIVYLISIIIISIVVGLFVYIPYKLNEGNRELNERIKDNINLSKPFNEVVAVSSDFISGAEGWYFVSIQATCDDYPGSPQWIYDFRYDDNTDTLYYDDDIEGIGVINYKDMV